MSADSHNAHAAAPAATGPILSPGTERILMGVAGVGGAIVAAGIFVAPEHGWTSLLTASFLFMSMAVGALALLAMLHVTKAGWSAVIKRIPEALTQYLKWGSIPLLAVLAGAHSVYPWSDHEKAHHDPILAAKLGYMNLPFFAVRMVLILVVWNVFAHLLRKLSTTQDKDGSTVHTAKSVALSAAVLGVFGVTVSMASFEWLMSTEPLFFSTIYGMYNMAGALQGATAAIVVAFILLRRGGHLPQANTNHLHDLGKLLFGFSTFWAYLWVSQFLLIWYSNIPEEAIYYTVRLEGSWSTLFYANLIICWALPFMLLLPQPAKRSETRMMIAAAIVIFGRWLDVYLMSSRPHGSEVGLGIWELGGLVGGAAFFALVVARGLKAAPLVAAKDPYIEESLHHHAA